MSHSGHLNTLHQSSSTARLFMGILPSPTLLVELEQIKQELWAHWGLEGAFNSPAHLTLFPPWQWPTALVDPLVSGLRLLASSMQPFPIHIDGFACFQPRVLFARPILSAHLMRLHQNVTRYLAEQWDLPLDKRSFHPHITVARRDLAPHFEPVWKSFRHREFIRTFPCQDLALFQHNGRRWIVRNRFCFRDPPLRPPPTARQQLD